MANKPNLGARTGSLSFLKQNWLTIATFISVVVAISVGLILRSTTGVWSERSIMYLEFPGTLFLRALTALIIPLVISSILSSIGRLDVSLSGRIGLRALIYYLTTTILAVALGIILVYVVHPGTRDTKEDNANPNIRKTTTVDTILDLIRNLVPPNLVQACFAQYQTILTPDPNELNETDIYKWKITGEYKGSFNILGLVAFSIVFGIIIELNKQAAEPLLNVVVSLHILIMKMTAVVIILTPLGILFLIMPRIISVKDVVQFIGSVGWYTFTVLLGLFIHGFLVLPSIYFLITRKNPFVFILKMSEALLTAFGTSSSSATLPVTMRCLEEKVDVDERVVNVVIPVGATINMDGTALYEAVAAIFIAQTFREALSFPEIIVVSLTATAASIGAAGIPQAGLVTMVMVLNAIGLPEDSISIIFAVDWFLDRFRTAINVLGDSFGAAVVSKLSEKELKALEPESGHIEVVKKDASTKDFPNKSEAYKEEAEKIGVNKIGSNKDEHIDETMPPRVL